MMPSPPCCAAALTLGASSGFRTTGAGRWPAGRCGTASTSPLHLLRGSSLPPRP